MSGSDSGVFNSPARPPTDSVSPARLARTAELRQIDIDAQNAEVAQYQAQIAASMVARQEAFEANQMELVRRDHHNEMDELRSRLTEMELMESNADAQPPDPPLSSRPTYSANEIPVAKTLSIV